MSPPALSSFSGEPKATDYSRQRIAFLNCKNAKHGTTEKIQSGTE